MFSLESPNRGDSNDYTQYTCFDIIKKITLNYPKICSYGMFFKGLKNEFETAVVNEPSVFKPLNQLGQGTFWRISAFFRPNCVVFFFTTSGVIILAIPIFRTFAVHIFKHRSSNIKHSESYSTGSQGPAHSNLTLPARNDSLTDSFHYNFSSKC